MKLERSLKMWGHDTLTKDRKKLKDGNHVLDEFKDNLDLKARQKSELNIEDCELKYMTLLSQSSEGVFVFDPQTRKIIESNKQFLNLLDYKKDEYLLLGLQDILADDPHRYKDQFAKVEQGEIIQTPVNFICKDGQKIETDVRASLIECDMKKYYFATVTNLSRQKQYTEALKISLDYTKRAIEGTVNALTTISEKKDPYTNNHQARVAKLASSIAKEIGLEGSRLKRIIIASQLHDLGKINIPTDILAKPGTLSAPEMEIIKDHPASGCEILAKIPFYYSIATIVFQHHERWNGSGYPDQLKGEDILLEARIIAVADVVEAISSHRPYRPALGIDKALEEIEMNSGILYDPQIVKACLAVFKNNAMDIEKIFFEES